MKISSIMQVFNTFVLYKQQFPSAGASQHRFVSSNGQMSCFLSSLRLQGSSSQACRTDSFEPFNSNATVELRMWDDCIAENSN